MNCLTDNFSFLLPYEEFKRHRYSWRVGSSSGVCGPRRTIKRVPRVADGGTASPRPSSNTQPEVVNYGEDELGITTPSYKTKCPSTSAFNS